MGFFDAVRRALHRDNHPARDVARAWGLEDENEEAENHAADASLYDRAQWQKKMKRILAGLPETRPEWTELMTEARALNLEAAWIRECEVEEFKLLVRRAVADRHFTETEHRRLDLARDLIGLPEDQAEKLLHNIIADAEKFFGGTVEGA